MPAKRGCQPLLCAYLLVNNGCGDVRMVMFLFNFLLRGMVVVNIMVLVVVAV